MGGDAATGGDFSGWKGWTKINAEPFLSKGHGKKMVDVYVPAEFADAYRAHAGAAPVGIRMVKVAYKDAAATTIDKLTVMTKMSPGYDADHGDWWYGVYDESGTKAAMSGKIEMCVSCHEDAPHDYVFGVPRK